MPHCLTAGQKSSRSATNLRRWGRGRNRAVYTPFGPGMVKAEGAISISGRSPRGRGRCRRQHLPAPRKQLSDCPCLTMLWPCPPVFRTDPTVSTAVLHRRRSAGTISACSRPAPAWPATPARDVETLPAVPSTSGRATSPPIGRAIGGQWSGSLARAPARRSQQRWDATRRQDSGRSAPALTRHADEAPAPSLTQQHGWRASWHHHLPVTLGDAPSVVLSDRWPQRWLLLDGWLLAPAPDQNWPADFRRPRLPAS